MPNKCHYTTKLNLYWNDATRGKGGGLNMAMKEKNYGILLLCMLAGLTVGNFAGELCQSVAFLKFMDYGQAFGLENPVTIDLGVLVMSIQVKIHITLAGILGMVGGILIYKKL